MRDDQPEALRGRPGAVEVPEAAGLPAAADIPAAADWPRRNDSRSPAELNRRLDSLPDGHPSSRYEADGTLRDSPVRLSELETPPPEDEPSSHADIADSLPEAVSADDANRPADIRPYTDAEWADHITEVRTLLADAQKLGLATNLQHTVGPDKKEWSAERNRVQGALIADLYEQARDVPCEGRAIIAGGLGGAGKTTILSEHAGIDRSQYLAINPDNVKEEMARRGLMPEVEGLSPMEASELAHEESSYIAKRLALRASADGKNLIWDVTMSSLKSTQSRISELRSAGYAVDGIFVDIPIDTSIRRTDARHREGHEAYRTGIGLGGRYVPPEVIKVQADPEWGCNNRKTFEEVSHLFDHWSRYDNSIDGRPPVLVQADSPAEPKEERA